MPLSFAELERQAYISGDVATADYINSLDEATDRISTLQTDLEEMDGDLKRQDAMVKEYKACFTQLSMFMEVATTMTKPRRLKIAKILKENTFIPEEKAMLLSLSVA